MELAYARVVAHGGASFYVSPSGEAAYLVYAGTVVSVARDGGEVVQFGLELRGPGRGDSAVASYVAAELARAEPERLDGDGRGGEGVFVDALARLRGRGAAAAADLCGRFDVPVDDPYLAECFVSLGVAAGLVLTTGYHDAERRVLHLFDAPAIANALSGFAYTPNRACFALVQACLPRPPSAVRPLLGGLFARVAAEAGGDAGAAEAGAAPANNVIVTTARALGVRRVGAPVGGGRAAALSNFVQVRLIPRTYNAWAMEPPPSQGDALSRLCAVVRCADAIVLKSDHWAGIDETLNEARGDLVRATTALFGPRGRRGFVGESVADYGFSFCQRFALCQFLLARWGLASCYGALEHLAASYAANYPHRAGAPLDEGTVADAANDVLRELCVLGQFAEALARADLGEPPRAEAESDGAGDEDEDGAGASARALELEADAVLRVASRHTRRRIAETGSAEELRRVTDHIRALLAHLYARGDLQGLARMLSSALRTASPYVTLMEVELLSAFDRVPACQRGVRYLAALADTRLAAANIAPPEGSGSEGGGDSD
ncbi:Tegument protein UL21 [Caprine alphaherpesvirus 1]|uniref:Tegument protein UL21 n=1 Tax=Caprine alphaherpesvirus 1 TaxID=39944 RepID=A0AAF1D206_9ALPH|nr:Tegument protein UL21 [Caprine alphaherpesvirus 1]QBM10879.1 Tegument protein UL21 [Caprine alphaherpesvirus 1]